MDLDTLSHALRNLHVVLTAHILLDVGCQIVTSDTDGVIAHNTAQRDDGDLGGATADINNHVALWGLDVDTNANGCCHRLKNEVNITTIGMLGRVANSTKLHLR